MLKKNQQVQISKLIKYKKNCLKIMRIIADIFIIKASKSFGENP